MWSRRATDFIYRFPAIAEAVRALGADQPLACAPNYASEADEGLSPFVRQSASLTARREKGPRR